MASFLSSSGAVRRPATVHALRLALAAGAWGLAPHTAAAQLVRSAAGANAAAIQTTVDQFRTDLGTLNANVAGSFGTGRREINWDGVPAQFSAPNNMPANFFNVNSPRGAVFSTSGTGFEVSGATGDAGAGQPAAANFGNIDPSYGTTFATFSPQRLFTALGSNVLDVSFFVPGAGTAALVRGFGSVFSDVDLANTTSIQLFDANNASLGTFFAPNLVGSQTFSFLGISFAAPSIARVRITSGNSALGAGLTDQNGVGRDVVAMDDFIYGEPVAISATPEPAAVALVATGLLALAVPAVRRRRRA